MKITRAIKELEALLANHGDIEICLNTDQSYRDYDGSFIDLFGFTTEKIYHSKDEETEPVPAMIAVLDFHKAFIHEHE